MFDLPVTAAPVPQPSAPPVNYEQVDLYAEITASDMTMNDQNLFINPFLFVESPEYFKNVCQYHPELITPELAMDVVSHHAYAIYLIPKELLNREMVETAIRRKSSVIEVLKPFDLMRLGDPMFYYRLACSLDGLAIEHVPEMFRTPVLMDIAIAQNPQAIIYSPYQSENREEILEFIKNDPSLYAQLPGASPLRHDHEFMKTALTNEKNAYLVLKAAIEAKNKDIICDVMRMAPDLYTQIPSDDEMSREHDIMETAMTDAKNIPWILEVRDIPRDLVLKAVKINGLYLQYVNDAEFRKDPEIIEAALKNNPLAIEFVHPSQRYQRQWYPLLVSNPKTLPLTQLPHRSITQGRVWSEVDMKEILSDRADLEARIEEDPLSPEHPQRPIALMIYAKEDDRNSFRINAIHRALAEGYEVAYYEVESEAEFIRVMNHYLPLLQNDDLVFLGGHGSKKSLALSSNTGEGALEIFDREELMAAIPEDAIPAGVRLILHSCSNAADGADADNMMNMMYEVFRGRWHVYAQEKATADYVIFNNREIVSMGQHNGYSYHRLPDGKVEIRRPHHYIAEMYENYDRMNAALEEYLGISLDL